MWAFSTGPAGPQLFGFDLMEEFRPCMADRFVLTCINNRIFQKLISSIRKTAACCSVRAAGKPFSGGGRSARRTA